jgi:L-lactate permease
MLAHREAKEIALGTDGKLRILANLISEHYPERTLILLLITLRFTGFLKSFDSSDYPSNAC